MNFKFVSAGEKKKLIEELGKDFGIEKLNYLLIESGRERIRGFTGKMRKEEIVEIGNLINVELIGLYLINREEGKGLRLSFDSTHVLRNEIKQGVLEINDGQLGDWLRGKDLEIVFRRGNVIIKHGEDLVGCGKSNGLKIFNYVPKDRRLKSVR